MNENLETEKKLDQVQPPKEENFKRYIPALINFKNPKPSFNTDGWMNPITNLGNPEVGRVTATTYYTDGGARIPDGVLASMYQNDVLCKKAVDFVVNQSFKSPLVCDPLLIKELKRIKGLLWISVAAKSARLYGNSLIIVYVDDGRDLYQELNVKSLRRVYKLEVLEQKQFFVGKDDLSTNIEYYNEPEFFTIRREKGVKIKVHRSRCYLMTGEIATSCQKKVNKGRDNSVLQSIFSALRNYASSNNSVAEIVQDFNQVVITLTGLANGSLQPDDAERGSRIEDLQYGLGTTNALITDQGEEYKKHIGSVAGLDTTVDRFAEQVCAGIGISFSDLFGRSAGGLNSAGKKETEMTHDTIMSYRADTLEPVIDWLISMLKEQSMWTKEKPESFEWSFPSLVKTSEKEQAEIRKIAAETAAIYIDRGAILNAVEFYNKRYENGDFKMDVSFSNKSEESDLEDILEYKDIIKEKPQLKKLEENINKE